MTTAEIEIDKLNKSIVLDVEIRFSKEYYIRLKIAGMLIRMAAWILGCGITINEEKIDG